jgi:hypothetical protein
VIFHKEPQGWQVFGQAILVEIASRYCLQQVHRAGVDQLISLKVWGFGFAQPREEILSGKCADKLILEENLKKYCWGSVQQVSSVSGARQMQEQLWRKTQEQLATPVWQKAWLEDDRVQEMLDKAERAGYGEQSSIWVVFVVSSSHATQTFAQSLTAIDPVYQFHPPNAVEIQVLERDVLLRVITQQFLKNESFDKALWRWRTLLTDRSDKKVSDGS